MEETTMPRTVTDCDYCGEIDLVDENKMCLGCERRIKHRKVIHDIIQGERAVLAAEEYPEEEIDELTRKCWHVWTPLKRHERMVTYVDP
jgi:hypothetical protein